jgi:hypothetical protein
MANVPIVIQGPLNRVRCSVIVPNNTSLNILSQYMGKNFARIAFEGDAVTQHETGVFVINSPEPYIMATITCGLLRSQALANNWLIQMQTNSGLGPVTIHSDTSAFQAITLYNSVIRHLDPGAYDGTDPVVSLTIRGLFPVNSDMWNYA